MTLTILVIKLKIDSRKLGGNILNPYGTADLLTFTEEILNGKLYFLYDVEIDNCLMKIDLL